MSGDEDDPDEMIDGIEATRTRHGAPPPPSENLPATVGRYRILSKLGEGGMGVVYEAEQESPRRRVAVKVVRGGGFVDDSHVRMFQREADTLARLQHPGIGSIYESGRTEDGRHFFAMELVRGRTLDDYLEHRPVVRTEGELRFRLALFRGIADAVHYAHQRGVIHRDLKPSNIIVADRPSSDDSIALDESPPTDSRLPSVKILDFGLARITEGDLAVTTMTAEIGMIKGTLPYMSPEQARGNPDRIDLRTDVYALGVILYEMLANRRPYDVLHKSLVEALRVICEQPAAPLGRAMSGMRRLDRDVETIVGRALEKDVERRYASAAALSDEVMRYLTSQPILARPPSAIYQLRKLAARNRTLFGGIVTTFTVLVIGIAASTVFGFREAEQRRESEAARNELEAVVEFQVGMLRSVDPRRMGQRLLDDLIQRVGAATRNGGAQALEELSSFEQFLEQVNMTDAALRVIDDAVLDRAAQTIEAKLGARPSIEARMRLSLAGTYGVLGLFDKAEVHQTRAAEIYAAESGQDHLDTLAARNGLAVILERQGRLAESESVSRAVFEAATRTLGDEHELTTGALTRLAIARDRQQDFEGALSLYEKLYDTARRTYGNDHVFTVWQLHNIGSLHRRAGRPAAGEPYLVEALTSFKRLRGELHHDTLWAMDSLAFVYLELGRLDEAEKLGDAVLEQRRKQLGADHLQTLESTFLLGRVYLGQGRLEAAESAFRVVLDKGRRSLGGEHWLCEWTLHNLGDAVIKAGRNEEAAAIFEELLELRRRMYGEKHKDTIATRARLLEARDGDTRP